MAHFDPYHVWLGIRPADQPANHYRLLGLQLFESDAEAIGHAADSRMRYVRTFQSGAHAERSQKILNELAAARICLLNPEKKAEYDAQLQAELSASSSSGVAAAAVVARPIPIHGSAVDNQPDRTPTIRAGGRRARPKARSGMPIAAVFAAFALLVVVLIAAAVVAPRGDREQPDQAATDSSPRIVATRPAPPRVRVEPPREDVSRVVRPVPPAPTVDEPAPIVRPSEPSAPVPAPTPAPLPVLSSASEVDPATLAKLVEPPPRRPRPAEPISPPGDPKYNELEDAADEFSPKRMGKFITALCEDLDGRLWVGTEDTGVWRYDPAAEKGKRWSRFTRRNTGGSDEPDGPTLAASPAETMCLGDDDAYALACDKLGRVWVGHLNHGVSVYNGQQWRYYDILTGPIGERVFDIETSPVDGDVWIATNVGLARYRLEQDEWCYYTRADGLPSDAIQCLAFDKSGTLFVGTQCDGLAISPAVRTAGSSSPAAEGPSPKSPGPRHEYKAWRTATAAPGLQDRPPSVPLGEGLPTDLINDIIVARDGAVYVATPRGLVASRDKGRTWQFVRGKDWEAKAKGLYQPPSNDEVKTAAALAKGRTLLAEDYCTALAEDAQGRLWVGHREKGFEIVNVKDGTRLAGGLVRPPAEGDKSPSAAKTGDYLTRWLLDANGAFAGTYGGGLARVSPLSDTAKGAKTAAGIAGGADTSAIGAPKTVRLANASAESPVSTEPRALAPLPSPARPPTAAELEAMLVEISKPQPRGRPSEKQPVIVALPDDWRTQGDWLGRYGRYWACCAAICSPSDYICWRVGWEPVEYTARISPHHTKTDSIRYCVHWLYTEAPLAQQSNYTEDNPVARGQIVQKEF